jgi:F-type H+-transporting ATPase subunit epsilon
LELRGLCKNSNIKFTNRKNMSLQVCIMTPDRIFWNDSAEEIILPTNTGQMGVLTNHAPLITALDIGVMLIRAKNDWISVALMGGFALVKQNKVTVLVNEAESAKTIDAQEAENSFLTAKNKLEQAEGQKQKVEANFAFKRARARYQVVKQATK